jgi:transposase
MIHLKKHGIWLLWQLIPWDKTSTSPYNFYQVSAPFPKNLNKTQYKTHYIHIPIELLYPLIQIIWGAPAIDDRRYMQVLMKHENKKMHRSMILTLVLPHKRKNDLDLWCFWRTKNWFVAILCKINVKTSFTWK